MLKLTPKRRVLFVHRLTPVLLVFFGVFSLVLVNLNRSPLVANAAAANTVNFQARLQTNSGAIVPDGNYNIEFKLYSGASCNPATGSGCTSVWNEDYLDSDGNGLQTVNGYLSANLGSVNPFPSTIQWDQKLWLSMNIGGNQSIASWDGEMMPYLSLTAVPAAFSASQLATSTASGRSTLTFQGSSNGDQNFVIQDQGAAGTYSLLTSSQANTSFIQLQTAIPTVGQTGSLNISGTGTFGTSVITPLIDTPSGTLTIGSNSTVESITLGSQNTTSSTTIQGGTGGVAVSTGSGSGITGSINIQTGDSSAGTAGNVSIDTGANTVNGTVISTNTFETTTENYLMQYGLSSAAQSSTFAHSGSDSLAVTENSEAWMVHQGSFTGHVVTPGHMYKFSAWVRSTTSENISGVVSWFNGLSDASDVWWAVNKPDTTTGWTQISGVLTAPALKSGVTSETADIGIHGSGGGTTYIDDVQIMDMTAASAPNVSIGATNAQSVTIGNAQQTGATTVQGGAAGLNLQVSSGASINIGAVGTTYSNTVVHIADSTAATYSTVSIGSTSGSNSTVSLNAYSTSESLTGSGAIFKSGIDSATAFQIQDAASNSMFNVDTSARAITLGAVASSAGYTGTGTNDNNGAANGIQFTKITTTAGGNMQSISTYFGTVDAAPNNKFQVAIYDDTGAAGCGQADCPGTKIASSGDNTAVANSWVTTPLTATLAPNTTYWLAVNVNSNSTNVRYDGSTGSYIFQSGVTYNTWPSTYAPSSPFSAGHRDAMYLTLSGNSSTTINGTMLVKPTTGNDATNVFQIQNAGGTSLFNVDSTNNNITLGAGTSFTITGGNTASRPSSPTEGMMYYDTATHQLLVYSNGKWQSDRSSATKIVAASNATQAEKDGADYVATGTNDQIVINNALTAAAGGKVYLTEGAFTISDSISIPDNTTLAGAGEGTLVQFGNLSGASKTAVVNTDTTTGTGVTIRDLRLDGNSSVNSTGAVDGIYFLNVGTGNGTTAVTGALVTGIWVNNFNGNGVKLDTSSNSTVTNNTMINDNIGIFLNNSNRTTVTGNNVQGANTYGLDVAASVYDLLNDNIIVGSGFGTASTASGVYINGGGNSTFSGNKLRSNGGSGSNDNLRLHNTVGNTITDNNIDDTAGTGYAIDIDGSGSTSNYLADNYYTGTGATTMNDSGVGTIFGGQMNGSIYTIQPSGAIALNGAGNSNFSTTSGTLTLQGAGATTLSTTTATASSNITIQTGNGTAGNSGSITIDAGTSTGGTAGTINIGTSNASGITIGRSGITTTVNGTLDSKGGITIDGTNTTSNNSRLFVSGTLNSSATGSNYGIQMNTSFNPSGASLGSVYGIASNPNISGSSLNLNSVIGVVSGIQTSAGYTGTITSGTDFQASDSTIGGSQPLNTFTQYSATTISNGNGTTGTVNNMQLYLQGSSAAAGTGGTVNNYGTRVTLGSGSGAGTTTNYGIYVGGTGGTGGTGTTTNYGIYLNSNVGTASGTGVAGYAIYSASSAASVLSGSLQATSLLANTSLTVGNTSTGGLFVNDGATLNTSKALTNFAVNSAIGTAANTVDNFTSFTINQITSGVTLTIPNPTTTTAGRIIYISNIGSATFTIGATNVGVGMNATFIWNGTAWVNASAVGGATGNYVSLQSTTTGTADTGNLKLTGQGIFGSTVTANALNAGSSSQFTIDASGNFATSGTGTINTTSATAFNINKADGTTHIFNVDTSNGHVNIDNPSDKSYALNVSGDINSSTNVRVGGVAVCVVSGCTPATGSNNYIQNATSTQDLANFNIRSVTTGAVTAVIQGANGQTADIFQVASWNGTSTTPLVSVSNSGMLTATSGLTLGSGTTAGSMVVNSVSGNKITVTAQSVGTSYTIALPGAIGSAGQCLAVGSVAGSVANMSFTTCGGGSHSKSVTLTPEYAGAVLNASNDSSCTSANTGTMTSDNTGSPSFNSFYKWTGNNGTTNQCFDVVVRIPLPSDYSNSPALSLLGYSSDGTAALNVDVHDTSNAQDGTAYQATSLGTGTWNTPSISLTGTYVHDGIMTVRIRMTAKSTNYVELGNLVFSYNSSY